MKRLNKKYIKQYKNNNIRAKTLIKIFLDYWFKSMATSMISSHKIITILYKIINKLKI